MLAAATMAAAAEAAMATAAVAVATAMQGGQAAVGQYMVLFSTYDCEIALISRGMGVASTIRLH